MKLQEQQEIDQAGYVEQRGQRYPWFAMVLALMSIPLIIGGVGLLIFAGVTLAGVTLLILTVLLLVVGISLLIAAAVHVALSTVQVETRQFSVREYPRLVVNNEVGTIHINAGSNANIVTVQATHHIRRWGRRAPQSQVRYEQVAEGNVLSAKVDRVIIPSFNFPQHIDFDVTIPGNADLELTTSVGDIWVTGISGQLSLQSDTGSIYVRQGCLTGYSLLRTDLGSIHFHEAIDAPGTYKLLTDTGSVNVTVPREAAFELDASTSLGSVATNIPEMAMAFSTNHEGHAIAGPPPRAQLMLRSSTGSVNVYEESDG